MSDTTKLLRQLVLGATSLEGLRGIAEGLVDIIEEKEVEGTELPRPIVEPPQAQSTQYERPDNAWQAVWDPLPEGKGRTGWGLLVKWNRLQGLLTEDLKPTEHVVAGRITNEGIHLIIDRIEK